MTHLERAVELVLGDIEERLVVIGPCHVACSVLCSSKQAIEGFESASI